MNMHTTTPVMNTTPKTKIFALLVAALLLLPAFAYAGNGFFITTYGGRYQGLGGTYITLGGTVMSLQSNPATLLYLNNGKLEMGSALIFGTLNYQDRFVSLDYVNHGLSYGNAITSTTFAPIPYFGFAAPIGDNMAWGIAAYAQAGGGVDINGITSLLPLESNRPTTLIMNKVKRDQFQGAVFFKITPGLAYEWNNLKIGVGLDLVYGELENTITFKSYDNSRQLLRFWYKGDPKFAIGGKIGVNYTWEYLTVGYAYMLKNDFDFDGEFSETDINGNITSASVKNSLSLPDRHSFGISATYGPWTVAADANFYRYADYFQHRRLVLSEPLFPGGATVSDELINYKDQWVYNAGVEYRDGPISYRAGWNYGRSPIRETTVSPQDNLIAEHHAQVGIGLEMGRMTYSLALEMAFKNTETGNYNTVWGKERFNSREDSYSVSLKQTLLYFSVGYNI